jgi:predicted lipoprotein with Yx(FWY)xxD motif
VVARSAQENVPGLYSLRSPIQVLLRVVREDPVIKALAASAALAASLVLAAAGCGDDDSGDAGSKPAAEPVAQTPAADPVEPAASRPGTKIGLIDSRWGKILSGPKTRAIYLFTREKSTKSRCYDQCAVEWPPVLTKGKPRAASGVKASKLGTTKRSDGKLQVTYAGHPLYYWYKDPPGQVVCQAVNEFGGYWYVVEPSGDAITES